MLVRRNETRNSMKEALQLQVRSAACLAFWVRKKKSLKIVWNRVSFLTFILVHGRKISVLWSGTG